MHVVIIFSNDTTIWRSNVPSFGFVIPWTSLNNDIAVVTARWSSRSLHAIIIGEISLLCNELQLHCLTYRDWFAYFFLRKAMIRLLISIFANNTSFDSVSIPLHINYQNLSFICQHFAPEECILTNYRSFVYIKYEEESENSYCQRRNPVSRTNFRANFSHRSDVIVTINVASSKGSVTETQIVKKCACKIWYSHPWASNSQHPNASTLNHIADHRLNKFPISWGVAYFTLRTSNFVIRHDWS